MKSSYILFGIITFLSTSFLTVDGSIITVCKSCEVSSVKGGIALAQPHDTVLIKSGEYYERTIIIDKPLTLLGEDRPIIDAEFEEGIFEIRSDSVILDGLQIQKVGVSYTKDFAAILINRSENFEIKNCVLKDVFFGILPLACSMPCTQNFSANFPKAFLKALLSGRVLYLTKYMICHW